MRKSLLIPALLLVGLFQSCNCGTDPVTPGNTTPTDTTGFVSKLSVNVHWTQTEYVPFVTIKIDSAGQPLTIQPGDSMFYLGYNGQIRYNIQGYDSLHMWSESFYEIVDSGTYLFTWKRGTGPSEVKASFSIKLHPFNVTAPAPGAMVQLFNHTNDTVFYRPDGGTEVEAYYSTSDRTHYVGNQNTELDNGKYAIIDCSSSVPSGPGFLFMIRHFVNTLASPAPFKKVDCDYWQSSKHVDVNFRW
ncbi:MAG: hypothetical protein ABI444_05220 [Candidatus Kapaibacterium sp.]|jgi:hypothetical protein